MNGRSIRYLDGGGLEVIEIDVPDPGYGEVQLVGGACGICAWDQYTFRHGANAPAAAPPGHEGTGYIAKVGPGVTGLKEGDHVAGGGFFTRRNLPASGVYLIPPSDLAEEYWTIEPLSCCVTGVDHCNLQIGDRVAVVGCGFMGMLLLECLTRSFAEEVIAVDVDPRRLEMAKGYGAQRALNPRDADFEDQLAAAMARPIDTVVDCSGAQAGLDLSTRMVKRGGRLNFFGWIHGQATFSGDRWHGGGITVVCSSPSAKIRDTFPVAIRLIHSGMIDTKQVVTHVVTLDGMGPLLDGVAKGQVKDYMKGMVLLNE